MTNTYENQVREFHLATGCNLDEDINDPANTSLLGLRLNLLKEELSELDEATRNLIYAEHVTPGMVAEFLKELADLQYVLSGLAVTFRLPLEEAFRLVHQSNMSKLGDDGKPIFSRQGKVMKGPNYQPPDLVPLAKEVMLGLSF